MPLPREVGFDKDDFQKSRIYNEADSLVKYILFVLMAKPGNLPTMPSVGVDISKYVKNSMETLDAEMLKGLICSNCEDLIPYITNDNVFVGVVNDSEGRAVLLIKIPLSIDVESEQTQSDVYYAFYRDELNNLKFSFSVDRD